MERELVILQALKVVPDVIDALAFEAKKGNVQARSRGCGLNRPWAC